MSGKKYIQLSTGTRVSKEWIRREIEKKREILQYRELQYEIFYTEFQVWTEEYAKLYQQSIENLRKEINSLQALLQM